MCVCVCVCAYNYINLYYSIFYEFGDCKWASPLRLFLNFVGTLYILDCLDFIC